MARENLVSGTLLHDFVQTLKSQLEAFLRFEKIDILSDQSRVSINKSIKLYYEIIDKIEEETEEFPMNEFPTDINAGYIDFLALSTSEHISNLINETGVDNILVLHQISENLHSIKFYFLNYFNYKEIENIKNNVENLLTDADTKSNALNQFIVQNKVLSEDLKSKTIKEIYTGEGKGYRFTARVYECLFYILVIGLAFLVFYHPLEYNSAKITEFLIQKITLVILSASLAAFLIKRSFMNRRLADEAYKVANEIDGLSRYTIGMPDELIEKLRFDLAYKYFGREMHSENYSADNFIHEQIKANTEFMKQVKEISTPSKSN